MRLFQIGLLLLATSISFCKKNNPGTSAPTSYLSIPDVTKTRDGSNSTLSFVISVENPNSKPITVNYTTQEGTAKANIDFIPVSGTLTINPNSNQATIDVTIIGRQLSQGSQQFVLALSNPSNAFFKLGRNTATAAIQNTGTGSYTLAWEEEFNGNTINTNDWNFETGGGGWGNNELQNYTSGTNNAYIENGSLVIEAKKEASGNNEYSSARLTTKGKKKFTYGKIDIRAKIPVAKGVWPALWMLGENINEVSWPACGEIDIMESIGEKEPSKTYGTLHWGTNGHQYIGGNYSLATGDFSQDYHIFSIEWTADKIVWFVDGNQFYQLTKTQVTGPNYPFDKDFFFIINVAVGGNWPGNPDATTTFPQKMFVDYVRVYQK